VTHEYTIAEFVELIRPEVEADIDRQIAAEPDPEGRRLMTRYRSVIVSKMLDSIRIRNLERRLAETEARLRPRLVEIPEA
jgi:hypothetical protein